MENERLAEKKMEARGRRKVEREHLMGVSSNSSRESYAGIEEFEEGDEEDSEDMSDDGDEYLTTSKSSM